eukprot:TRINITY_DN13058_c0_g1_i1.p1 TRINITY_DN13058_c0_g1~~TRINITY_DN13058_c0_g1_i1.p1  ORF type:complete len:508 (-),score=114.09 TRINITY_DN13058_c0_g1_i1:835-2358(-)
MLVSMLLVKYYVDKAESYFLGLFTVTMSLTLSLICILLIPLDTYVTSRDAGSGGLLDFEISRETLRSYYIYFYGALMFFAFFLIPFSFFYGEQRAETIDDYETVSKFSQIVSALKHTFLFIMFCAMLLVIGLFFRTGTKQLREKGIELEWVKQIFDVDHFGESAISFCTAIFASVGTLCWVIYGSYGLGSLPFYLLKGSKSLKDTKDELVNDLAKIRGKYRAIQEKYLRSHSKISKADQRSLNNLKKQEKMLNARQEKIGQIEIGSLQKVFKVLEPFRILLGLVCLGFSAIILFSLAMTTVDKFVNSKCGLSCGFIIERPQFLNPTDALLVYSSKIFPLDYIFFALFVFYITIACIYGIVRIGIKILCFTVFEIRKEATTPQALLIMAFIVKLIIFLLSTQVFTLSPQYSTFGSQVYRSNNGEQVHCSLDVIQSEPGACRMTNISIFYNKISVSLPFFSTIFFIANGAYIAFNFLVMIYSLLKKPDSRFDEIEKDEDEGRGLLNEDL